MSSNVYPEDIRDWNWETLVTLTESSHTEDNHIEYKKHLSPPDNTDKSDTEWRRDNIEREAVAFANTSGGFLIYGVSDDVSLSPFKRPENEVDQYIAQSVAETRPKVKTTTKPISVPNNDTDRIVVVVQVKEANRKPVATGDSAFYIRNEARKQPASKQLLESWFVERDRRQQAMRQLEMELDKFDEIYDEHFKDYRRIPYPPEYHLLNIESLREVLNENTHLYSDDNLKETINRVFSQIRTIEDERKSYQNMVEGLSSDPWNDPDRRDKEMRDHLEKEVGYLKRRLDDLREEADI